MANDPKSTPSTELADRLVLASVRLTRRLRAQDEAARLSGPQASALAVIVHAGRIRPSRLAELEEVRRPTIARVLSQLQAQGLIRRETDPEDGRASWVVATCAGAALISEGQARRIAPLARQMDRLGASDRAAIEFALPILERLSKAD